MNNYEGEKYFANENNVLEIINKYGVAIIPNILNEDECEKMKNGMWDYLEYVSKNFNIPINRQDKNTWNEITKLSPQKSMLFQHWSIGHAQFIWDLRTNEKIVNIFSKIWKKKNEELLVSFDGASFQMPPEETGVGWFNGKNWLHCDQSYTRCEQECIQSWITAHDVNEGDATLAFLEYSHQYFEEVGKHFNLKNKADWVLLHNNELDYYMKKGCQLKYIKCPKGSLVCWDSRTVHCGQEAMINRKTPNNRCVVYLCYTPRDFASKTTLEKKKKYFKELRTTTHWPHKIKVFTKTPQNFTSNISQIKKPNINKLGMLLAGFNKNDFNQNLD